MLGFLFGLFMGAIFGVFMMALVIASRDGDDR